MFAGTGPLDEGALAAARALLGQLPQIREGGIERIYLHWTVAPFGCVFRDYNAEVDLEGGRWVIRLTHDPIDNATGDGEANHTFRRNTGAVGISIAGMDHATFSNFGPDPVQMHEMEYLCAAAAAFARKYSIQSNSPAPAKYPGGGRPDRERTIMTHAEAALMTPGDGDYPHYYCFKDGGDPDCRWDLATTNAQGHQPTEAEAFAQADALRARIRQYKVAL